MHAEVNVSINKLPALMDAINVAAQLAAQHAAETIRDNAIAVVPVRTGALQDSIEAVTEDSGGASVTAGNEEAYYAQEVEYGTTTNPPQPFMHEAFEGFNVSTVADNFVEDLQNALGA